MNLLDSIKYGISNSYILNTADLSLGLRDIISFTKYINCNSENSFCDTCSICSRINKGEHPDLIVVPNDNNEDFILTNKIKIDDIRSIQKEAILNPVDAKYRILVINYADRMTEQAQNSLLKILEETPSRTIIFLITDNMFELLNTIRSRCRQINYSFKKTVNINFMDHVNDLQKASTNLVDFFNKTKKISLEKDKSSLLDFIDFSIIFMRDILVYSKNGTLISNGIEEIIKNIKIEDIPNKIDKLNNYRFLVKNRSINKDLMSAVVLSTIIGYQ